MRARVMLATLGAALISVVLASTGPAAAQGVAACRECGELVAFRDEYQTSAAAKRGDLEELQLQLRAQKLLYESNQDLAYWRSRAESYEAELAALEDRNDEIATRLVVLGVAEGAVKTLTTGFSVAGGVAACAAGVGAGCVAYVIATAGDPVLEQVTGQGRLSPSTVLGPVAQEWGMKGHIPSIPEALRAAIPKDATEVARWGIDLLDNELAAEISRLTDEIYYNRRNAFLLSDELQAARRLSDPVRREQAFEEVLNAIDNQIEKAVEKVRTLNAALAAVDQLAASCTPCSPASSDSSQGALTLTRDGASPRMGFGQTSVGQVAAVFGASGMTLHDVLGSDFIDSCPDGGPAYRTVLFRLWEDEIWGGATLTLTGASTNLSAPLESYLFTGWHYYENESPDGPLAFEDKFHLGDDPSGVRDWVKSNPSPDGFEVGSRSGRLTSLKAYQTFFWMCTGAGPPSGPNLDLGDD